MKSEMKTEMKSEMKTGMKSEMEKRTRGAAKYEQVIRI